MVNVGLIGLGKMGLSHLAIVNTHPAAKLIGVCDTASYLCSILHKYTGIEVFSNYRELPHTIFIMNWHVSPMNPAMLPRD